MLGKCVTVTVQVRVPWALLRVGPFDVQWEFEAVQEHGEAADDPRTDLDTRSPRGSLCQVRPKLCMSACAVIIALRLHSSVTRPEADHPPTTAGIAGM